MAAPVSSGLQSVLQAAVQSVQWTYSLFWQLCPQKGILEWGDGCYNGAIKTRKTVQPMEVSAEESSLQRSQQLRELYESLSAGETNQPTRRPCAALSPEDLTESEWFYLMCVSFSFPPGVGLPGKAYGRRQHVWLAGADNVDSKTFSRSLLAKSAHIQTVVCIPLLEGVVEFGTTDKVQEDLNFIQRIKSLFIDHHPPPPRPALSEHSTSSPDLSPPVPAVADPQAPNLSQANMDEDEHDHDEEEEEDDGESDSEAETVPNDGPTSTPGASDMAATAAAEASELMQVEMSEDIRVGSTDNKSNNLDSDVHLLAVSQRQAWSGGHPGGTDRNWAERSRRWGPLVEEGVAACSAGLGLLQVEQSASVVPPLEDYLTQGDNYSQTVSTILQNKSGRWPEPPSAGYLASSSLSAFAKWTICADYRLHVAVDGTSQWLLKHILLTVPYLHAKHHHQNSPPTREGNAGGDSAAGLRGKGTPQYEQSASHVAGERRRPEKLNERFIMLRLLLPFVTRMDKASILGDTIEYVKQLRKRIQDLEAQREGRRRLRAKTAEVEASVQVSIIESEALLEVECEHREGLLLDVMRKLREVRMEVTGVQARLKEGVFVAELRAKVKENANGKKASIVEVKRALFQIIPNHARSLASY